MNERAGTPKYGRGDLVVYVDRHDRLQTGRVLRIEAEWTGWSAQGTSPLITYWLSHPTYHENRCISSEEHILHMAGHCIEKATSS